MPDPNGAGVRALQVHFENVRETMQRKAEEAGLANNKSLRGAARELVVAEFFQANLPQSVSFPTGEIVDVRGQRSGQMDIMIIPAAVPRFTLSGTNVIALAAGVVGAVEVKSNLTTSPPEGDSELTVAMKSCAQVRALDPGPLEPWPWSALLDNGREAKLETIPYSIFAFQGPTARRLLAALEEWDQRAGKRTLPNTVTVLDPCYSLVLNDGWLADPGETGIPKPLYLVDQRKACLATLFDYWMKCIQAWTFNFPYTPLNLYLGLTVDTIDRRPSE